MMARKVSHINNRYTQQNKVKIKVDRVVRKRMMVFGSTLAAILLVLVALLIMQMHQNNELKQAHEQKQAELAKLQDKEIALKEKLKQLNNKEYITKIARSEYFLSNDGEIIFKLPDEDKKNN